MSGFMGSMLGRGADHEGLCHTLNDALRRPVPSTRTNVEVWFPYTDDTLNDGADGIACTPGGAMTPDVENGTRTYCIDDAVRRAFLSGDHYYELYTVTQPGGWRGPVGFYQLTADKGATANLVAFCPLDAKKVSLTTFEWTARNFMPERQLGMLFFVDPDAASSDTQT